MKKAFENFPDYDPGFIVVMVNKRINTRLALNL